MYRATFSNGGYEIRAEGGLDVLGESPSIELRKDFIRTTRELIEDRPLEVGSLLASGNPIFFLAAHGGSLDEKLYYFSSNGEAYDLAEKIQREAAEGSRVAFISSCNSLGIKLPPVQIPVIYQRGITHLGRTDTTRFFLPEGFQTPQVDYAVWFNRFIDVLRALHDDCDSEDYDQRGLAVLKTPARRNWDKSYQRLRDVIQNWLAMHKPCGAEDIRKDSQFEDMLWKI